MIDIYAHIGLPRFGSAESFIAQMDANGVDQALLSTGPFCPDVLELARAARQYPERFRIVGLPVGSDSATRCQIVSQQLQGGFSGLRIPAAEALDNPAVLDIAGRAGAFLIIVGFEPWLRFRDAFLGFLALYPDCFIIGGHFAGVADPVLIQPDGPLHELYAHPRFHVALTRQGLMDAKALATWTDALVEVVGWKRLLWGSEWPVALWRNETYADTMRVVDRFHLSPEQRNDFFAGNARRLVFNKPGPVVRQFTQTDDVMMHKSPGRISLLPHGLDISETQHLQLMDAFFKSQQHLSKTYRDFVQETLMRGLESPHGPA